MEDYKKKYEEVLKRIKECVPDDNGFITIYPQEIFPELMESEDEKIRKEMISFFKTLGGDESELEPSEKYNSWVAWLEKQREQKAVKTAMEAWKDMRLEVYAQASGNRHEPNYSDDNSKIFSLNDIDEIFEKVSDCVVEQKPVIVPKFKVGDWITIKE